MTTQWIDDLIARRQTHRALERAFYTDQRVFEAEMDRLFRRWWLNAGHVARIKQPGDYFLYKVGLESIIVIRGHDGEVHAFHNVCRHRGSAICAQEQGHAKKLLCPYHNWVYDTNGALLGARAMPEDFDRSSFGLDPVKVQIAEGFIFVCLSDDPPDFKPVHEELSSMLGPYRLDRTKVAFTKEYLLETNWKMIAENAAECYHCGPTHPEYLSMMIGAASLWNPKLAPEDHRRNELLKAKCAAQGLKYKPHATLTGYDTWALTCREPMAEGFVTQSRTGKSVAPLLGELKDPEVGVVGSIVLPTLWFETTSDVAVPFRVTPVSATKTHLRMDWLVREDAVEGKDYDLDELTWFFVATGEQDWNLCVNHMAGVMSETYRPGPHSLLEGDAEYFLNWYLHRLSAGRREER